MAEPTVAQRKMYAKMKLAMPDGSYYIRNGSVGAQDLDNAIRAVGRTTSASGDAAANAVRRHIMTRAAALKLSSKIPDTWNPDGSLKHDDVDEFLEHFGVKGMHWGVRSSRSTSEEKASGTLGTHAAKKAAHRSEKADALESKAKEHEQTAVEHGRVAQHIQADHHELLVKGTNSSAFKKLYGDNATAENDWKFYAKNGESKAEALRRTSNDLRLISNSYVKSANQHSEKAAKLREKAAELRHADNAELDEFLEHFGVKGMRWGVRRSKSASSVPYSSDAHRAHEALATAKAHGTHVLSNDELAHLTNRLNLEQNYHRLTSEKSQVDKGHTFVKQILGGTKTALDLYNTGRQVQKAFEDIKPG